jgi:hypothetical protein
MSLLGCGQDGEQGARRQIRAALSLANLRYDPALGRDSRSSDYAPHLRFKERRIRWIQNSNLSESRIHKKVQSFLSRVNLSSAHTVTPLSVGAHLILKNLFMY